MSDKIKIKRAIKVNVLTTDNKRVIGKVNLGKYDRFSDLLANEKSVFITLYDITSEGANVRMINKFQIVWAEPTDETVEEV